MIINNIIKKTLNFQKFYHKLKYKEVFKCLAQTQKCTVAMIPVRLG